MKLKIRDIYLNIYLPNWLSPNDPIKALRIIKM